MKIAIQGHPTRGKEIIQLLESLGGKNGYDQLGSNERFVYFINNIGCIYSVTPQMCSNERKIYTLEEFEKEFPFKVGDKVIDHEGDVAIITGFAHIEEKLGYSLQYENGRGTATSGILKPYKEMKEERNITLTLDKAKEWYNKGGELKEIALQAFGEKELNPLPRSWEEYTDKMALIRVPADRLPLSILPEKYIALYKLEQLRDCWRQGDVSQGVRYKIKKVRNIYTVVYGAENAFLSFCDNQTAEEFLECFRDLIEKAGDLI